MSLVHKCFGRLFQTRGTTTHKLCSPTIFSLNAFSIMQHVILEKKSLAATVSINSHNEINKNQFIYDQVISSQRGTSWNMVCVCMCNPPGLIIFQQPISMFQCLAKPGLFTAASTRSLRGGHSLFHEIVVESCALLWAAVKHLLLCLATHLTAEWTGWKQLI